jgi:hypothetical protein
VTRGLVRLFIRLSRIGITSIASATLPLPDCCCCLHNSFAKTKLRWRPLLDAESIAPPLLDAESIAPPLFLSLHQLSTDRDSIGELIMNELINHHRNDWT